MAYQHELKVHNNLSKQKERFVPIDPARVRMYVCGMTVYDYCHIGHARVLVVFDVINRYLRRIYGDEAVTYVRNITDIDDKIIARANDNGEDFNTLTGRFIAAMHEDADALGVERPDLEPRATLHMGEILAMIEKLIAKGYAYAAANGDVYYDVSKFAGYGKLSGKNPEDLRAGERVAVDEFKDDPLDFVLWKAAKPGEPSWDSPWGAGRPGWHIECSAMSTQALGNHFDIHGGGLDLQFPHHENEIAQSCCAHPGAGFANIWLHNEMLQVEGRKMSKSLGNFFTVRDLLDRGVAGEVIRFVMLSTHYRKPMDWTEAKAADAEAVLRRWHGLVAGIEPATSPAPSVIAALADDLNSAGAIAALHELAAKGDGPGLLASARMLGLLLPELAGWATADDAASAQIEALLAARLEARKARDFARADAIRDGFAAAGVEVKDTPAGPEWSLSAGFDPERLAELARTQGA